MPTDTDLMRGFEFGPWHVIPERGLIRNGDSENKLEPLVMDVFVVLASHGGEVVTKDQLIDEVWDGRPQTDDVIARCIAALRRGLGDDARQPRCIETIQRRGYRVMLPVNTPDTDAAVALIEPAATASLRPELWMIVLGLVAVLAIGWFALNRGGNTPVSQTPAASVAVFQFDCLLDTRESSAHLCFGFAEQTISTLKQVDGMQIVRMRNNYDASITVAADSIVAGSVQIIGDEVKIAARLEDARTGVVRWSDTFDARRNGIFKLQRQVANALLHAVDSGFAADTGPAREPSNFAAAEAYALGRYLFEQRDADSFGEAIAQFEEAIRLDPAYGPAWLGLAYTYSIWPDYDLDVDRQSAFDKALEIMDAGIKADPSIRAAAGTVYGYIFHKRHQWAKALANTTMAVSARSPEVDDYHWHSRVLASVGRLDESLEYARRGMELDPQYAALISRFAIASFWVNDLENAAHYFQVANQMKFEAPIHVLAYSLFLIRRGEIEEAKLWTTRALEKFGVYAAWVSPVFDGIGDAGKRPRAITLLEKLQASGEMPENVIITLSVLLGDTDRAIDVARGAESANGQFELELIYIDEFKAFRRHPGFDAFVDAVGLSAYWRGAGCDWIDDKIECN